MNKKLTIKNESKASVAKMTKEKLSAFSHVEKAYKRTKTVKRRPMKATTNKLLSD